MRPVSRTPARSRLRSWTPVAIGAFFAALYGVTLPHQFSYDGLCYALDVERAPLTNLFHANHLLYSAAQRGIWRLALATRPPLRAIFPMQQVNAVVGAAAVAVVCRMLLRRFGVRHAIVGAALLGFAHTFWREVTDPGCYAFALLATVLLLHTLLHAERRNAFLTGLFHGVTVLFHQMLILVVPAFVWRLKNRGVAGLSAYLGGLLVVVGGAYGTVAILFHHGSLGEAFYWALGPGGPPPGGVGVLSTYWWQWKVWGNFTPAWNALVGSWIARPKGSWLPELLQMGAITLVAVVAQQTLQPRAGEPDDRRERQALWLWILAMNVFQFFFWVGTERYRLLFLPPLIYLGVGLLRNRGLGIAALAVLCLGLWNFETAIRPAQTWSPDVRRIEWVAQTMTPKDFLIFLGEGEGSIVNVAAAYFAPNLRARSLKGYLFATPSGDLTGLKQLLAGVTQDGGKVVVESTLLASEGPSRFSAPLSAKTAEVAEWLRRGRAETERTGPGGYRVIVFSRLPPA